MDLGLYVHVPFCPRKCGYCDFYSVVPAEGDCRPLAAALLTELQTAVGQREVRVETMFVGGGTPTFLPSPEFDRLFSALGRLAAKHDPVEFTVEANPASLTAPKAALLRGCGVNRISMGAQSFNRQELEQLDRLHSPEDISAGATIIRQAGFEHFSLDLIFGIPGQTLASWTDSLRRAIELGPDHLACYGLTYEPGTPLRAKLDAGRITPVDEETEVELYLAAIDHLAAAGFRQYEISNFARPDGQCRHNLRYWRNQPGLGIGPSAASYLDGRRWRNVPDVAEYIDRITAGRGVLAEEETLSPRERAGETAMLQLRLIDGIRCCEFHAQTGFDPLGLFAAPIAEHGARGLLTADADRIALTRRGRPVADAVIADFLLP